MGESMFVYNLTVSFRLTTLFSTGFLEEYAEIHGMIGRNCNILIVTFR